MGGTFILDIFKIIGTTPIPISMQWGTSKPPPSFKGAYPLKGEVMDAAQLIALILGTAGVVVALNAVWTLGIKPGYQSFMKNRQRVIQVDQVPEISSKVEEMHGTLGRLEPLILSMHHELHPNSGTSMNDKLTRTEEAVERIETSLLEHVTDPHAHH